MIKINKKLGNVLIRELKLKGVVTIVQAEDVVEKMVDVLIGELIETGKIRLNKDISLTLKNNPGGTMTNGKETFEYGDYMTIKASALKSFKNRIDK
jgi:NADPH-dependent curcumin reductase CurA